MLAGVAAGAESGVRRPQALLHESRNEMVGFSRFIGVAAGAEPGEGRAGWALGR